MRGSHEYLSSSYRVGSGSFISASSMTRSCRAVLGGGQFSLCKLSPRSTSVVVFTYAALYSSALCIIIILKYD